MTDEENKQQLIEFGETVVKDIRQDPDADRDGIVMATLKIFELGLAKLKEKPVQLPRVKHPAQFDYADQVIEILKSHGIEVQE